MRASPSPQNYQNNEELNKKKELYLSKVGQAAVPLDEQNHSMFASKVPRDIRINKNPGPGTYDVSVQEKLKTLNF